MLMPKKTKHRKMHRGGKIGGFTNKGGNVTFGEFGMRAVTGGLISARQIEAARRAMTRYTQRGGRVWIRIFPDKPMTAKGAETPMGKGKGTVEYYVAKVRPGRMLFEMAGVPQNMAREAMRRAGHKLCVSIKFVIRESDT